MAIDQEIIERAKRTDLVALVQSKVINLKKKGKSHVSLCPFHTDKIPYRSARLKTCSSALVAGRPGTRSGLWSSWTRSPSPRQSDACRARRGITHGRQYEVKGICRSDTQLKATVKASKEVAGGRPFELSTIDLYSSRSRLWFGKLCAELFGAGEAQVRADMDALLERVEAWRPPAAEQTAATVPTGRAKAEALRFLKNPDIFAEILADLDTLGVPGEETNKLVGYLAAVSRKTDEPLSVLIQSRSAAGKSTLQDAIVALVPEEDYVKYTIGSPTGGIRAS